MDKQFISSLGQTLQPNQWSASIHRSKLHLISPLQNSTLLASFTTGFSGVGDNKLLTTIYSIFMQLQGGNYDTAFTHVVSGIAIAGSTLKSIQEDDSSPVLALTGIVQGLSHIGRYICRHQSHISPQGVLDALRTEYAHLRRDAKIDGRKKISMVIVLIEMIKICTTDLGNPNIMESILASTQGILDDMTGLPKSVSVTFHFFLSKHHLFLDQFETARVELEQASRSLIWTKPTKAGNRILFSLIPLNMVRGIFPRKNWLKNFPDIFNLFYPIIRAIRGRDLSTLSRLLDSSDTLKNNFFFLLHKLPLLVHRLLLKDIVDISESRRVSVGLYSEILRLSAAPVIDSPTEIFSILIHEGMISGYISYEENVLMLTGSSPFPLGPYTS